MVDQLLQRCLIVAPCALGQLGHEDAGIGLAGAFGQREIRLALLQFGQAAADLPAAVEHHDQREVVDAIRVVEDILELSVGAVGQHGITLLYYSSAP